MNKPEKHTKAPMYDYFECRDFLEKKYKCNTDDFAGKFGTKDKEGDFERYERVTGDVFPYPGGEYPNEMLVGPQEAKGYTGWKKLEDGAWFAVSLTKEEYDEHWRLIHEQFQRFSAWIKDNETPYLNFWHYLGKFKEIHNGGDLYLYEDEVDEDMPEWVKTIYTYFLDEFGAGPEGDRVVEMETSW